MLCCLPSGGYTWHEYAWEQPSDSVSASLTASRLASRFRAHSAPVTGRPARAFFSPDQFPARHSHMAALDARGYLYISGGLGSSQQRATAQTYLTDMLRSSISFANSSHLAAIFGASVGRCGIGLYCFDDSTSVGAGGVVACTKCSQDHLSLMTLCIVVGVLSCALVAFILWRNFGVTAEHEKPVGVNEHLVNEDEVDE